MSFDSLFCGDKIDHVVFFISSMVLLVLFCCPIVSLYWLNSFACEFVYTANPCTQFLTTWSVGRSFLLISVSCHLSRPFFKDFFLPEHSSVLCQYASVCPVPLSLSICTSGWYIFSSLKHVIALLSLSPEYLVYLRVLKHQAAPSLSPSLSLSLPITFIHVA